MKADARLQASSKEKKNFSGKLPYTYPRYSGALHTYQHKVSDKLDHDFGLEGFNPQWEFGFGLSYTTFKYSDLRLSADTVFTDKGFSLEVSVTNTGSRPGKEVVQVYLRDLVATITPDDRKLVAFDKVHLEAGESKTLAFDVTYRDMQYMGVDNKWTATSSDYEILVGGLPGELLSGRVFYAGP